MKPENETLMEADCPVPKDTSVGVTVNLFSETEPEVTVTVTYCRASSAPVVESSSAYASFSVPGCEDVIDIVMVLPFQGFQVPETISSPPL